MVYMNKTFVFHTHTKRVRENVQAICAHLLHVCSSFGLHLHLATNLHIYTFVLDPGSEFVYAVRCTGLHAILKLRQAVGRSRTKNLYVQISQMC